MKPENAIEVTGVTKKFKVYYDKGSSLKERVLFKNRSRHEVHWVLRGIDFEVKKGESVGLIGRNGCGKSTMLKMLTRIMYPTDGTIEMDGRVSSLLELGAGFHPDMSGRENIYTNASIFGLNRSQIEKRIDAIIRFSELGEFIDNPVRTYSSGMYMRLAFAVAIHVDADILLIDEILAVGDAGFQEKCFEKLKEIKVKGTTVVIVSHVMGQLESICDRVLWLEDGRVRAQGSPGKVSKEYLMEMEKRREDIIEQEFCQELKQRDAIKQALSKENAGIDVPLHAFCNKNAIREGSQEVRFTDCAVRNLDGQRAVFFKTGEKLDFWMEYHADEPGKEINFTLNIARDDGIYCFGTSALSGAGEGASIVSKSCGEAVMKVDCNSLQKGRYLVEIGIIGADGNIYDCIHNAMEFRVKGDDAEMGLVHLKRVWKSDKYLFSPNKAEELIAEGYITGQKSFAEYYATYVPARMEYEIKLAKQCASAPDKKMLVSGYCQVCGCEQDFQLDFQYSSGEMPNYRERLSCPGCGLNSRQRFLVSTVLKKLSQHPETKVYLYEQVTPVFKELQKRLGMERVTGSEYISTELPSGTVVDGIRHENAENLSFADESFDFIVSCDVFEHVNDYKKCFREAARILRGGGGTIYFSIPFLCDRQENFRRAEIMDGNIVYHADAVYHGNPIRSDGALVFWDYGWDLLKDIKDAGFCDVYMLPYYNRENGYLGDGVQFLFVAVK